ncbi:hypothetical protein OY671_008652, partial [Metschnikowia pulcherrima]
PQRPAPPGACLCRDRRAGSRGAGSGRVPAAHRGYRRRAQPPGTGGGVSRRPCSAGTGVARSPAPVAAHRHLCRRGRHAARGGAA